MESELKPGGRAVGLERLVGRYRAAASARHDVALKHRQQRAPYAGIAGLEAARDAYERCARELERTLAGEDPPMPNCEWPEQPTTIGACEVRCPSEVRPCRCFP